MNYWDYIRVEDLLSLQSGLRDDGQEVSHDECLFIVAHQVYELWFKLVLRELGQARDTLRQNPVPDSALASVVRSLRRVITIFEVAVEHFKLLETLTTRDYLAFRDRLIPASGFQSAQMREMEIVMGLSDDRRISFGSHDYKAALRSEDGTESHASRRVAARLAEGGSLKHALYDWLARTPVDGAADAASVNDFLARFLARHRAETEGRFEKARAVAQGEADVAQLRARYDREIAQAEAFFRADDEPVAEHRAKMCHVRAALLFLESYRELPRLSWPRELLDAIVALEQAFVIWRQRHARMVERVIGRRTGTGGSSGVDYLDQTALKYRVFDDVWAVRAMLLQQSSLPPLRDAGAYGFKVED